MRDPLLLWGKDEYGVPIFLASFADPHILHSDLELLRYVSRDSFKLEMIGCGYKSALLMGRPKKRKTPVPRYGSWEALPVSREDPQQMMEIEREQRESPYLGNKHGCGLSVMVVLRKPSCALRGVSLSILIPYMLRVVLMNYRVP